MRIRHFFVAILLLASLPAPAAISRNLYEASVSVDSQNPDLRPAALRAALEIVLVRVTGQRSLPAEVIPLVSRASDLVQGYGYEAQPSGSLKLKAQFDARAVDAALRSLSLSVWGSNRPSHLAWIAIRDDSPPRQLMDATNPHASTVNFVADGRGLPLTFPAIDGAERQRSAFNSVWEQDVPALREASRHYAADALLIGRLNREGGSWVGRWTVLNGSGPVEDWTETRDSLDGALVAGIHGLADRQAARFGVQTSRAQELLISVSGVQSVKDYGRVVNYLRTLGAVRTAQVTRAEQDRLSFRLKMEGDPEGLARTIAAGSTMRPDSSAESGIDQAYVLLPQ